MMVFERKKDPTDSCINPLVRVHHGEQSETGHIEGQENMHGDNTDVYSSAMCNQANM